MEIVLKPSIVIPICIVIFCLLVILAISFSRKGKFDKYFSIALVAVVFSGMTFLSMRKTTIDIDESGINLSGAFTGSFSNCISWDSINTITLLKDYRNTEYNPTRRIWGAGLPGYGVGIFQLANNKTANCIQKGPEADAVFIDTKTGLYFLSFEKIADVYDEISKHAETVRHPQPASARPSGEAN